MRQKAITGDLDPGYLANVKRVRGSSFYRIALDRAEESLELLAELGQPLEADLPKGSIKSLSEGSPVQRSVTQKYLTTMLEMMGAGNPVGNTEHFAHISVVLRGPKGKGKLILFASGIGDSWTFHSLDVVIEGREERIPLMPSA
ncbi:MAG: hypothetical protein H7144_18110 [Burkholderiales bacterium]|nr:hypothetical protein [Phycisphaerae bacterium]